VHPPPDEATGRVASRGSAAGRVASRGSVSGRVTSHQCNWSRGGWLILTAATRRANDLVNDLDLVVIVVVATALGAVGHRLELRTIESVRLIPFALARIRRPGSHRGRRRVAPRAAAAATESLAFTSWPTAAEPTSRRAWCMGIAERAPKTRAS
jgi:hypothetical protein